MPAKRVVAITGVAGGIGAATARVFRENGWCVVGVDRRDLNGQSDAVDQFIKADISEIEAPHAIFESIFASSRPSLSIPSRSMEMTSALTLLSTILQIAL